MSLLFVAIWLDGKPVSLGCLSDIIGVSPNNVALVIRSLSSIIEYEKCDGEYSLSFVKKESPEKIARNSTDMNSKVDEILILWNEAAVKSGMIQCVKITPTVESQIKDRIREGHTVEEFKLVFNWLAGEPFYTGKNDRKWRADVLYATRTGQKDVFNRLLNDASSTRQVKPQYRRGVFA